MNTTETIQCTKCNGTGEEIREYMKDGKMYPCTRCYGKGEFSFPDTKQLVDLIKGRKKGTLRSARPTLKACGDDEQLAWRSYYVWRLARYHAGIDVSMPVNACCMIHGDPHKEVLDFIAEKIASVMLKNLSLILKKTGKGLSGVSIGDQRWYQALTGKPGPDGPDADFLVNTGIRL